MAKLIITIEEKEEKIEGKTLVGYGVWIKAEPEVCEGSMLHDIGPILRDMIGRFICEVHKLNGAAETSTSMEDASVSFESLMAKASADIQQPFPTEI
jgi:hypothetical protein